MNILYLSHCVPYPPNKGDRIRSYFLIRELSRHHRIFLHALTTEAPAPGVIEGLEEFCESVVVHRRSLKMSSAFALLSIFTPFPLSLGYFFSWPVFRAVRETLRRERIDAVFGYSSSVAQYVFACEGVASGVDLVDADSVKWGEYVAVSRFPKKWIYALENRRLSKWEQKIQSRCDFTLVCSDAEKEKLAEVAPKYTDKVIVVRNGIDFEKFPRQKHRPISSRELLFTGQMDYLPNIDAALYFYVKILPLIQRRLRDASFTIVGRNPDPLVTDTCRTAEVTGEVKDVGEYLARAAVFVAPLRLAYGIQNKVLEAMASGVPVVCTPEVQRGLRAQPGRDVLVGDSPESFAESVIEILEDSGKANFLADNAYAFVREHHLWEDNIRRVDQLLRAASNASSLDGRASEIR